MNKVAINSPILQIWCLSHMLVAEYAVMVQAERLKKGWEDDLFSPTFLGLVLISKQYKRFRLASRCTKRMSPYDWTLIVGLQLMFPSKFKWMYYSGFNHNLSKLINWEKKCSKFTENKMWYEKVSFISCIWGGLDTELTCSVDIQLFLIYILSNFLYPIFSSKV